MINKSDKKKTIKSAKSDHESDVPMQAVVISEKQLGCKKGVPRLNGQTIAVNYIKPFEKKDGLNRGRLMERIKGKTLVMVGIHRRGEKGFEVRVKDDRVVSPSNITDLHLPLKKQTVDEEATEIKQ